MARRVHLSELRDDDDRDLRVLLERFIKKSEELERRESSVLKQVELVQSAVASLQASKHAPPPKPTPATSADSAEPPRLDIKAIERETRDIREETERIQREVRQKTEENRRLQEEIERRSTLHGEVEAFLSDGALERPGQSVRFKGVRTEEIESRAGGAAERREDAGMEFFNEKLRKLKELEKRLKRELEVESEEAKRRRKEMGEKMDRLERESQAEKRAVRELKGKSGGRN